MGWLGDGIIVVGIGLGVYFLVRAFRSGAIRLNRSSPLDRLEPAERRRALRQIRGREPVAADEAATLRPVAEQLAGQKTILGLSASMILVEVGQVVQRLSAFWIAGSLAVALLIAAGAALIYRDMRRARRFLRRPG
jgi:hypothetical protein